MKIKFKHTPTQYLHGSGDYDLLTITAAETQKFENVRSQYQQTLRHSSHVDSSESVSEDAQKKNVMKAPPECHSQPSEMSITELLTDSAEQDRHEQIMTETFSECHSQPSQVSITEFFPIKIQSSQFKSFQYMLSENNESMNESLSDVSDSDSAPVCLSPAVSFISVALAKDTESFPTISVTCSQ